MVLTLEMDSLDPDTTFYHYLGFLKSPLLLDLASGMVCGSDSRVTHENWISGPQPVSYTHLTLPTICSV